MNKIFLSLLSYLNYDKDADDDQQWSSICKAIWSAVPAASFEANQYTESRKIWKGFSFQSWPFTWWPDSNPWLSYSFCENNLLVSSFFSTLCTSLHFRSDPILPSKYSHPDLFSISNLDSQDFLYILELCVWAFFILLTRMLMTINSGHQYAKQFGPRCLRQFWRPNHVSVWI